MRVRNNADGRIYKYGNVILDPDYNLTYNSGYSWVTGWRKSPYWTGRLISYNFEFGVII